MKNLYRIDLESWMGNISIEKKDYIKQEIFCFGKKEAIKIANKNKEIFIKNDLNYAIFIRKPINLDNKVEWNLIKIKGKQYI